MDSWNPGRVLLLFLLSLLVIVSCVRGQEKTVVIKTQETGGVRERLVSVIPPETVRKAKLDFAGHSSYRYLFFPESVEAPGVVASFLVTSSSRASNLDHQLPLEISPGLWRIDLEALKWDRGAYDNHAKTDPYSLIASVGKTPLIIRGDWFLWNLSNTVESQIYYQLLYKEKPKTSTEFLKFWKVNRSDSKGVELLRHIESASGVSVQGIREVYGYPGIYPTWETRDFFKILKDTSPIENPLGKRTADGSEWITGVPKISIRNGTRGLSQVYLLSDSAGNVVDEAPGRLVEDKSRTFGHSVIVTPGSCHNCHSSGLNPTNQNALRIRVLAGVEIYDKKENREELDLYLLENTLTIKRHNEDFASYLLATNGLTPEQNNLALLKFLREYNSRVTLEVASQETHTTPQVFSLTMANANNQGYDVGSVLASLAEGIPISRSRWEQEYLKAVDILRTYKQGIEK